MGRTAPAPNAAAPPGMAPGAAVKAGGGTGGGGGGKGAGSGGGGSGGGPGGDGSGADGGDQGAGTAGADGDQYAGDDPCTGEGHPVDVATGRMFTRAVDFSVKGIYKLIWERSYSSDACRDDACGMGHGWRHSFAYDLEIRDLSIVLRDPSGAPCHFRPIGPGERARATFGRALRRERSGDYFLETNDGLRRVFESASADGRRWRLARVTDVYGNAIRCHYDDAGRLIEVIDTVGRALQVARDDRGRIAALRIEGPDEHSGIVTVARYDYSDEGDLIAVHDPLGHITAYAYQQHLMVEERDRNGLSFYFRYDGRLPASRCVETWGAYPHPDPAISARARREMGSPNGDRKIRGVFHRIMSFDEGSTDVYDTLGNCLHYAHGALGLVKMTVDGAGGVTNTDHDDNGFPIREVDADMCERTWKFDADGRVLERVDTLGRRMEFIRDDNGKMVELRAPNGGVWQFTRDRHGEIVAATDPLGFQRTYGFDERGCLIDMVSQTGARTKVERSPYGGPLAVTTPLGVTSFRYDRWGRMIGVGGVDGNWSTYEYDLKSQRVAMRDPQGRVTRNEYDAEGNPIALHFPDGTSRRGRYGGKGRLCEYLDERGGVTRFGHDWDGNLVDITNPKGEVFTFTYDPAGRVSEVNTFDGRHIRHLYTLAGRRRAMIDADLGQTDYLVDGEGNLLEQGYPDGSVDKYEYDALDFVKRAESPDALVTYARDLCGRQLEETVLCAGKSYTVLTRYDGEGKRMARETAGHQVAYERTPWGNMSAIIVDGTLRQDMDRDVMGRLIGWTLPGGAKGERSYEQDGKLARERVLKPRARVAVDEYLTELEGWDTVVDRSYEYSARDELVMVKDAGNGDTSYEYDPRLKLLSRKHGAVHETFAWDANGNRAGHGIAVDRGNRLVRMGDVALEYDQLGRVVKKTRRDGDRRETWHFDWHPSGCLAGVTSPAGAKTRYAYDAFGRRLRKQGDDGSEVRYQWDGNALLAERHHTGDEQVYLFDESDPFYPVAQRRNGAWFHFLGSPTGTPSEMLDSSAAIAWSQTLAAYGKVERSSGNVSSPLRFQGQYADRESGLHYNRFRYYDPELGVYLTPDPISIEGGLNEYQYTLNPIGWVDPIGWADGAALEANMPGKADRPEGHQAHHIVPEELYAGSDTHDPHPLLKGMDPHNGKNGIYLPKYNDDRVTPNPAPPPQVGQTIHRGSHPRYTEAIKADLDAEHAALVEEYKPKAVPTCARKKALEKVQNRWRTRLKNNTVDVGAGENTDGIGLNNHRDKAHG